jgi:hypothetical protein
MIERTFGSNWKQLEAIGKVWNKKKQRTGSRWSLLMVEGLTVNTEHYTFSLDTSGDFCSVDEIKAGPERVAADRLFTIVSMLMALTYDCCFLVDSEWSKS